MSDFSGLVDVLKVARSELVGKAKNIVSVLLVSPVPQPDDDDAPTETESEPTEWWQHYGFASRPPVDADVMKFNLGRLVVGLASRALATAKVYGLLGDGDVALYSTGNQVLRLNDDGSVVLMKETSNGEHLVVSISKDDLIQVVHPDGAYFEMGGDDGIVMKHNTKKVTIASGVMVQIVAPSLVCAVGANKLHVGAVKPMVATQNTAPNVWI